MLSACATNYDIFPPYAPFQKWHATTRSERQLDSLIGKIVEAGKIDPRVIAENGKGASIRTPKNEIGSSQGVRFIYQSELIGGRYFHADLKGDENDFFVPSSCSEIAKDRDRKGERFAEINSDPMYSGVLQPEDLFFYFPCSNSAVVRFYMVPQSLEKGEPRIRSVLIYFKNSFTSINLWIAGLRGITVPVH